MKIVLPFHLPDVYSPGQLELLEKMNLRHEDLIDHILLHWTTYAFGAADLVYEQTIDDLFSTLYDRFGYSDEWHRLQHILAEHSDEIVQMVSHLAQYLQHLLDTYPDQHTRQCVSQGEFHFLRSEKLDLAGRFLIITSDVADG